MTEPRAPRQTDRPKRLPQPWFFYLFAALEFYNAARRGADGDFGKGFWFFTIATVFFVAMGVMTWWQRRKSYAKASRNPAAR